MSDLLTLTSVPDAGHLLVQRLHGFYNKVNKFPSLVSLHVFLFLLVMPFLYVRFLFLNRALVTFLNNSFEVTIENYAVLRALLNRVTLYINYFHTFFNAEAKSLSWFMRPLFPLIKKHIHLQADLRNLLEEKIKALNAGTSGTRFVFLTESELWEDRNKAYSYLT